MAKQKVSVDEAITRVAESYRINVEHTIRKAAHRIVTTQSKKLAEKMKAIRAEFGNAAVDAAMKGNDADTNTWLSVELPERQPHCIEAIEKRVADGSPMCEMPEKRSRLSAGQRTASGEIPKMVDVSDEIAYE